MGWWSLSLWSAVGLTIVLGIGSENFKEFLRGARAIDEHFQKPHQK